MHRGDGIDRDQKQHQDLAAEDHIAEGQRAVNAIRVHGEQNGRKDVGGGEKRDRPRQDAPRVQEKAGKGAASLKIGHRVLRPAKNADRHRDKVNGRVREQGGCKLARFQNAPQDIRDIIGQHREQKAAVRPPDWVCQRGAAVEQDVQIFYQQDQNGKNADCRIIHTYPIPFGGKRIGAQKCAILYKYPLYTICLRFATFF